MASKPTKKTRQPPVGSVWRIQHVQPNGTAHNLYSADCGEVYGIGGGTRTVFDELVISFPGGAIHLEQMSARTWFLGVGEDKFAITVGRDGVPKIGERYR